MGTAHSGIAFLVSTHWLLGLYDAAMAQCMSSCQAWGGSVPVVFFDGLPEHSGSALIQLHGADLPLWDLSCSASNGVSKKSAEHKTDQDACRPDMQLSSLQEQLFQQSSTVMLLMLMTGRPAAPL